MSTSSPCGPQARPTCVSCRHRKVRCNRRAPCSQCSRLHLSCIYETPRRRGPIKPPSRISSSPSPVHIPPTQSKEAPSAEQNPQANDEILERLSRLESLVVDIHKFIKHEKSQDGSVERNETAVMPVLVPPVQPPQEAQVGDRVRGNYVDNSVFVELLLDGAPNQVSVKPRPSTNAPTIPAQPPSIPCGIVGTDVFGTEVDDISISSRDFSSLWSLYKQNFDPLLKVLHIPTTHSIISKAAAKPHEADDTTLTLLYAVSFAASVTISRDLARQKFGYDKLMLLRHLMQRLDNVLMRARFLLRPNVQSLTALLIYLVALKTHDAGRAVWILTGLAMRVAESLGVHENGARLGLDPFESEMRYRLWWHLTALDATAPENHGVTSTTVERDHAFRLPMNINDVDLSPAMAERPIEKEQWTEMSFSIVNLDLCRRLKHAVGTTRAYDTETNIGRVKEIEHSINQKWLQFADATIPTCRAADNLVRISAQKAQFILMLQSWLSTTRSTGCKYHYLPHSVFITAIQLLEDGYLLQSGRLFPDWAWFYQQHPQLYALFLVLRTLDASPGWADADRAWSAVDNYFTCLTDFEEASEHRGRTSCVWTVLGPLRDKARKSYDQMHCSGQDSASGEASTMSSSTAFANDSTNITGGLLSSLPTTGPSMEMSSVTTNQPALESSTFDNTLAWPDLLDWFNMDTGFI